MSRNPFPWQNRIVAARSRAGWAVEVWNPMTSQWEEACELPVWRPYQRSDAEAWAAAENAEQEARNLKTDGRLN